MFIKNWRPISLLNHDYKILTKALSFRIRNVLPNIIHHNQSAYVDGGYIGDTIRIIQDIMNYTDQQQLSGMLLFIDFQKAFDSIEYNFIIDTLNAFNFGENMIRWFKLLTNNIVSCVVNNGTSCEFFPIKRGVRQGDPLSPYLFILVIEVLANYIRKCKSIQGIKVSGKEIKLAMYADDITAMIKDDQSAKLFFQTLSKFSLSSGLKINLEKSEGLWLGSCKNENKTPYNITWTKGPVRVLGIYLSYNKKLAINANFNNKIEKLKKQLHWWKSRNLSLLGRVMICKTLGLSKFSLLTALTSIPNEYVKKVNKCLYDFIWKGNTEKVNRTIFAQEFRYGGYKMPDFNTVIKAAKIKWVTRYLDSRYKDWKKCFEVFTGMKYLNVYLQSNFNKANLKDDIPDYYRETIDCWFTVKENIESYQRDCSNQLLWYNKNFCVGGKPVCNLNLLKSGIWTANDLFQDGKIILFDTWKSRGASICDYLEWRNILSAVLSKNIKGVRDNSISNVCYPNLGTISAVRFIHSINEKDLKFLLNKTNMKSIKEYKVRNKHIQIHGKMEEEAWYKIYELPHLILTDNMIKEFQYKILFRYIGTNKLLYKMKKVDSPRCVLCELYEEGVEHLFFECIIVKNFWLNLMSEYNSRFDMNFKLTCKDVIFGYDLENVKKAEIMAINIIILYAKYFIYRCKLEGRPPLMNNFYIDKVALNAGNYSNIATQMLEWLMD